MASGSAVQELHIDAHEGARLLLDDEVLPMPTALVPHSRLHSRWVPWHQLEGTAPAAAGRVQPELVQARAAEDLEGEAALGQVNDQPMSRSADFRASGSWNPPKAEQGVGDTPLVAETNQTQCLALIDGELHLVLHPGLPGNVEVLLDLLGGKAHQAALVGESLQHDGAVRPQGFWQKLQHPAVPVDRLYGKTAVILQGLVGLLQRGRVDGHSGKHHVRVAPKALWHYLKR
mmetsp:Transcript_106978/g.284646  ORF Transcript_106978/g.284646 Transcript_106978/m.284646 type:complete len:231 (-) Transcript_106978:12-704(-)